jgi:hypothetical protein
MPNYDSGAYFLTTLVPISIETIPDGEAGTSPVHALRKALAKLPTARQTSVRGDEESPFACNKRTHFARFVVIDDVAYPGRVSPNTVLTAISDVLPRRYRIDPVVAQPQDHLANPFLFFSADFDAASGDDSERDSYLVELWRQAEPELRKIFRYCHDFDKRVTDAASFAQYIARCQVETTMPFHDYFMDGVPLDDLPSLSLVKAGAWFLGAFVVVFALARMILFPGLLACLVALAGGIAAGVYAVNRFVTDAGRKPFPPAPDATLPHVLKALHLQKAFTRFAIDHQLESVDAACAPILHDRFKTFMEQNKPGDLDEPTQQAGVVGI